MTTQSTSNSQLLAHDFDFDQVPDRHSTGSAKWQYYDKDVLPMWVADMDFAAPQPVIDALQRHIAHGDFGYSMPSPELLNVLCERLERLYHWHVTPEQIVCIPSLVTGINAVCRAVGEPGDGVLIQTPVYPPFLTAPGNHQRSLQMAPLAYQAQGQTISYSIDYDVFEAAITERTRLFLLCHPHNPTGVEYSRTDLIRMAEICERHQLVICSDEIHCDLLLDGTQHAPMASISPEIADRTITLMAPSKTFNVPGLKASFAIVQNPELRKQLAKATDGIVPWVNSLGLIAMQVAYRDCDQWLQALRAYLTANRNTMVNFFAEHLPQLRTTVPSATYLAWIDCRESGIEGNPYEHFLKQGRVALSGGDTFGPNGQGFVRLNFGCPRSLLLDGLERIRSSL